VHSYETIYGCIDGVGSVDGVVARTIEDLGRRRSSVRVYTREFRAHRVTGESER
jgi:hypothetical protein